MAQEDREAYIAWLRDEVGWHCNSRGCYEAFWDYDDSVTPDQMAEACANYEEAGFASPLNYLDESIMEKPGFIEALENELISAITRDAATAPEGVGEQWVESGDIWGDLESAGYEVAPDVLNGLKDAVRISDRAATIEPSASLTIDGWNQKLDDSLWALDFEDRNGVPPQLSDWLARDAEGEKGNESAKTSPVSLKTAAEEAHAVSTMLSKKNGGTDEQDGKDDLQRHMIPSEMRIPSQNDHHRAPSLSDIAAETRAASAAMETNIASRIDRERDAR